MMQRWVIPTIDGEVETAVLYQRLSGIRGCGGGVRECVRETGGQRGRSRFSLETQRGQRLLEVIPSRDLALPSLREYRPLAEGAG